MANNDCQRFESFDSTYEALIKAIVQQDCAAVRSAYAEWLAARSACQQIVVRYLRKGNARTVAMVDRAVSDAFKSLNGSVDDLLRYYSAYQKSRKEAMSNLCPPSISRRVVEAMELKPNLFGVGFDLKKLLGITR